MLVYFFCENESGLPIQFFFSPPHFGFRLNGSENAECLVLRQKGSNSCGGSTPNNTGNQRIFKVHRKCERLSVIQSPRSDLFEWESFPR